MTQLLTLNTRLDAIVGRTCEVGAERGTGSSQMSSLDCYKTMIPSNKLDLSIPRGGENLKLVRYHIHGAL